MKDLHHTPLLYAKIAGILLLISIVAGGFGELFVLSNLIVRGDATATARNIHTNEFLFRLGFASYLAEAVCDIALALIFYKLLKPVQKDISLLAAFFGLVSTTTFAFAEFFYFGVVLILGQPSYLATFTPDQLDTLTFLFLKMYGLGGGIFMVFYGVATLLRGYLIFRSGFLPKWLGALVLTGGIGFVIRNFLLVITPAYSSDFLLLPTMVSFLSLALWLLIKGVDDAKWNPKVNPS